MKRLFLFMAALLLLIPSGMSAKTKSDVNFVFPKDKEIKIVLFRPDVEVATLGTSGVPTPNPDWTADGREYLLEAIVNNQAAKANRVVEMPDFQGEEAAYLAEYQSLFRAVGGSLLVHNYAYKLPSKKLSNGKRKFDWTLGEGTRKLGQMTGANYGLFIYSYDAYATTSRKLFQFFMAAMFSYLPPGGLHSSYAALVDFETGQIVWFNFYASKKGDIRNKFGAAERADKLLSTLPLREGEAPVKKKK